MNEQVTLPTSILESALTCHREGRLAEAEALYQKVLEHNPRQHDALRLLGILVRQQGNLSRALDLLQQARSVNAGSADVHHDLGLTWFELADYPKAIGAYNQALEIDREFAEARYNLGNAYYVQRDLESAAACFQEVRARRPEFAEVHFSLGLIEHDNGRSAEAIHCYEQAIQVRPDYPEAFLNMSLAYRSLGKLDLAVVHLQNALKLRPRYSEALLNLGLIHQETGQLSGASTCFRKVLSEHPDNVPAQLNLSMTLDGLNQLEEAENEARKAVKLAPDDPHVNGFLGALLIKSKKLAEAKFYSEKALALAPDFIPAQVNLAQVLLIENQLEEAATRCEFVLRSQPINCATLVCLGVIRTRQRRPWEAIEVLERALTANPEDASAEINLAISELLVGRFDPGWKHYDARWRSTLTACVPRPFKQKRWQGEDFTGLTLLIHAEQGFGDTIQFVRYAKRVAERGGRVAFECQPSLKSLMCSVDGVDEVIGMGETLPSFDLQVPLLTLPEIFQTTLESIPKEMPYLTPPEPAPPVLSPRRKGEFRIGMVWRGSKSQNDDQRPVPLNGLKPLFEIDRIRGFSFQVDSIDDELSRSDLKGKILPLGPSLTDFSVTAALILQMDLMVTMDTAVCHLAGALGKPVWVLLAYAPDWRWLLDRSDSPWYPSMRLFRQVQFGEWSNPVERLKNDLQRLVENTDIAQGEHH